MDIQKVREFIETTLSDSKVFLIDVTCTPDNVIEVVIDCDDDVDIDDCTYLSEQIEDFLDRDVEDFELTVTSAGVGAPLRVYRQFRKAVGKSVTAVLADGTRILATMDDATPDSVTLSYTAMVTEPGRKRKVGRQVTETYPLSALRSVSEYLDFK